MTSIPETKIEVAPIRKPVSWPFCSISAALLYVVGVVVTYWELTKDGDEYFALAALIVIFKPIGLPAPLALVLSLVGFWRRERPLFFPIVSLLLSLFGMAALGLFLMFMYGF